MTSGTELFPILSSLDFDVATGIELCGNDEELYCDLIHELYTDVLAGRNAALRGSTPAAIRDYAHLLKGTLQVLGERRAAAKSRELEQALRNGQPSEELTRALLADLDTIVRVLGGVFDSPSR